MKKEIADLRNEMNKNNIDMYMVVTDDYHGSEYVGEYFKEREYLSGFTGSAGKMIITQEEACLWTDGRYFIQAEKQLEGTGISLKKMGEPGVEKIEEYIACNAKIGTRLGFDGRTVNALTGDKIEKILRKKNGELVYNVDLVEKIWNNRPKISESKAIFLDTKYAGESAGDKLTRLKEKIKEKECDIYITTALDEIAWLFNIRGNDVDYNPVILAYCIINVDGKGALFVDKNKLNKEISDKIENLNFDIFDYNMVYDVVKKIENKKVLIDKHKTNYMIVKNISCDIIDDKSPVMNMKAVKNSVEVENERIAHIKDSVAVIKMIYYLKTNYNKKAITELDVVEKLEEFRKIDNDYIEPSFGTISAFGSNGAIVHYEPSEQTNKLIEEGKYLLVDAGGHYYQGTTDMTRTISFGNVSEMQKKHYTAVLKGNLRLSDAKFLYGMRGAGLDYAAREAIWKMGLDYKHGTGHGVGYLLNVHESPNCIRWRDSDDAVLEEGMITSNEPGLYIENEYGIRLENLILCKKAEKNEYGQFMEFETLTYVPFDRNSIDPSMLNEEEKGILNRYNRAVYEKISVYLNEEERVWLKNETKEI